MTHVYERHVTLRCIGGPHDGSVWTGYAPILRLPADGYRTVKPQKLAGEDPTYTSYHRVVMQHVDGHLEAVWAHEALSWEALFALVGTEWSLAEETREKAGMEDKES